MEPWEDDEFDVAEEVEAVFKAQRRLSFRYGGLFMALTLTIPILHITWEFWSQVTIWGGFTLAYLTAYVLYPLGYILLALAYTVQANRLEEELLGGPIRWRE